MKRLLPVTAGLLIASSAFAGNYVGDYAPGDTVDCNFGTVRPSTGASFTLAGSPAISAYKDNGTTESTTGITLTADFDSRTGMNHVRVTTGSDGTFYAAGAFIELVITTGTVDSISVVGQPVCSFTLRKGTISGVPAATAGASGGLLISGTNSGTTTLGALTVSGATTLTGNVSMAAGLNITQSSSNTSALVVTGNGTGHGAIITSGSGATGNGLQVVSASTNGNGINAAGTGTGSGVVGTGGGTGHGMSLVGGATSGNGLRTAGTAGNSAATNYIGQGSAAGLLATGGATGAGASFVGGATSGSGVSAVASTSGSGIVATGVGTTQPGILATGGSTSSAGISATGGGTGSGILATSGSGATGNGITATAASTNGNGVSYAGAGTGAGLLGTGGATGHGMSLVGGATSGNGIATSFTAPSANSSEMGFKAGTLSGTHSSTTADLGSLAPTTISDLPGATLYFPTRNASRAISSYDTATGIATWTAALDADITLTNGDPWILYFTAPGSSSSAPTAAENADAVLDELLASHTVSGSLGERVGRIPNVAAGASGGLPTVDSSNAVKLQSGTGANQIDLSSGQVRLQPTQTGTTIPTVTTVTNAPSDSSGTTTLLSRLSATRAGYLDNLSAGAVATSSALSAVATSVDDLPTNSELATALGTADDATLAAIALLPNAFRDLVVEDQGSVSQGCVQAVLLAFAAGDIVTTAGSTTWRDPSNGEVRFTSTVTSSGNRTASITCPTY